MASSTRFVESGRALFARDPGDRKPRREKAKETKPIPDDLRTSKL
jgi:hypothetical protein